MAVNTSWNLPDLELAVRGAGIDFGTTINESDIRLALRAYGHPPGESIDDSDVRRLIREYVKTLPDIRQHEWDPVAENVIAGNRTLEEAAVKFGGTVPSKPTPDPPPAPTPAPPSPPSQPTQPDPEPDPDTAPETDPIDYKQRVRALYPYLPDPLVQIFADEWAATGNPELAQAAMRSSDAYDTYFEGNRRDDGTLRHTEAEYFSIKDAYRTIYREYGLNPSLFEGRFTELIRNDQSPAEHARKLGAAYEGLINNIPEVRQIYAQHGNLELSDQAIFASVIDPTIGEAIINRRISVAQVAGEGAARNFNISEDFAGDLVSGGLDQMAARTLFSNAEGQLDTLDTLVRRHNDPDDDFDIEEFADANVFGDAVQNRRIQRALRAEAALFTEPAGSIATSGELQVRGLSAQ